MRLKDKIGDRANASSEVEYHNAWGVMLGLPGKGVRTIVEMVVHTRLDCAIGSAALMRQCAQHAAHHASHRAAFGRSLADAPLMRNVLIDLAVETEAANALWARLARAFERAPADPHEAAVRRVATAVGKYWNCKRATAVAYESMECLGGNGYVEESGPLARLYRQAPLNAIWEGSGNVIALDILRALRTESSTAPALLAELDGCRGADGRLDALVTDLRVELGAQGGVQELRARLLCDKLAIGLQAATLVTSGHPAAAAAFCASRLPGARDPNAWQFGSGDLGGKADGDELLRRLTPGAWA